MIYLFHGTDAGKARAKAFEWVAKARAKEPDLVYTRLAASDISEAALSEAASAGGLFVKRLLVLIDDPFAEPVSGEAFEDALDALVQSDNAIVVLAPKLLAAKKKKLEGLATKAYAFAAAPRRDIARGFNSALVNALGSRSREKLWLEIERALRAGDAPEMLHGTLRWKARDLMEKGSPKWTLAEARSLSITLISLLQESRRGGLDLPQALERWALSI